MNPPLPHLLPHLVHHRVRHPARPSLTRCAVLALLTLATPLPALAADVLPEPPDTPDSVTVRGARPLQPAGQRSVPMEEMRKVPGSLGDPLKGLQSLPGIAAVNDGSSEPAIRGSRPEDSRFVIDGLPAGRVFHVGGLHSVLHPDLVSRFDLHMAAFGPEYGNATGGIVDVRLRAPRTDRIGGSLTVGLLGADLLVEGPVTPNQSFYFAGKRSWLDAIVKKASDGKGDGSDGTIVQMPRYSDYLGQYRWQLFRGASGAHTLRLHASGGTDRLDLEVPADSKLGTQDPVLVGAGRLRDQDHTEALTLDSQLGAHVSNRLSLGQHTRRTDNQLGSALRLDLTQRDRFVQNELRLQAGAAHSVALGAELHQVRSSYAVNVRNARCTEFAADCDYSSAEDVAANGRVDARVVNLYAKDRWQFHPAWAATAGLHHTRDAYLKRSHTQPRLALEWQWSANTLLSAAWGRHDQIPSAEHIVPDLGNPNLDHLHATHSALGLSQNLGGGWSWRAEAYHKRMRDLVVADAGRNFVNGGSGTAHGLELLLKKSAAVGTDTGTGWTSRTSGWLSVSWARSQRHNDVTGEAFRFAYDQPLIVNLVANYRLGQGWGQGWELGAKWTLHSGQPDTAVAGTRTDTGGRVRPVYGALNADRLPVYHRLDLRAEKQLTPALHVYAEVINAYNRKNVAGYTYSADYQTREAVTQLRLTPSAGIRLAF